MPWEYRGSNGPYYTRSKKVNGKVVRKYIGSGLVAEHLAQKDAEERELFQQKKMEKRNEIEQYRKADDDMEVLFDSIEVLAHAALILAGYHQHKHGEWRKRRGRKC